MKRYLAIMFLLISLLAGGGATQIVSADEPAADQVKEDGRAAEALEMTRDVARSLQIFGGEDRATKLTLVESPVQRFSNPVVGEFKQAKFWHPEAAGVAFKIVPDSAVPPRFAPARLREMRTMAREFHARIKAVDHGGGNVDEELRLLPQPVYRYKSEDPTILDGGIFSFVRGTDPELLLLIEARQVDNDVTWQYALAPMNSFEFQAVYRDREVWQKPQLAPPWTNVMDPAKPYFLIVDFNKRFFEPERTQ